MSVFIRQDPFREIDRLAQIWAPAVRPAAIPMDAVRRGDNFFVSFGVPGVEPSSMDLTVEKNTLTIKAERRWKPQENDEVLISERPQGSFSRQVLLGDGLCVDNMHASYERGVLSLDVPVSESVKRRRVEIEATEEPRELATQSS